MILQSLRRGENCRFLKKVTSFNKIPTFQSGHECVINLEGAVASQEEHEVCAPGLQPYFHTYSH